MKLSSRSVLLFFILIPLFSCRKDQLNDCFQSTGSDKTETRIMNPFRKIKIGEKFEITLTQDTTQAEQVKITCGSHIIGQIITEVDNNTLTIKNKNTCNFVRSYDRKIQIEIRVKFVEDIEIFSASNLSSTDTLHFEKLNHILKIKNYGLGNIDLKLNTGFLDVQSINSGNVILEGFSNIFTCSIEEVTQLDARKLLCDDVYIDCHTPLDCFVNPRKKLFVKFFNKGNIFYVSEPMQKPEIIEQKGSGGLFKL